MIGFYLFQNQPPIMANNFDEMLNVLENSLTHYERLLEQLQNQPEEDNSSSDDSSEEDGETKTVRDLVDEARQQAIDEADKVFEYLSNNDQNLWKVYRERNLDCRIPSRGGFLTLYYLNNNLKNFLELANLGPLDPSNPNSPPLNTLDFSILNRSVLTGLFNIYVHVNSMANPDEKQFLAATPLMYECFCDTFKLLEERGGFDPTRFRYASLQSIVNTNIVKKSTETADQEKLLKDPYVSHVVVKQIGGICHKALDYYRQQKKLSRQ